MTLHIFEPFTACDGLAAVLAPGGVPTNVGSVQKVYSRSQPLPYGGLTPALFIYPAMDDHVLRMGRAGFDDGSISVRYWDSTPVQQQNDLATVETVMATNRPLIIAAIRSDMSWSGTVSNGGATIRNISQPDGPIEMQKGVWIVQFQLLCSFRSEKEMF